MDTLVRPSGSGWATLAALSSGPARQMHLLRWAYAAGAALLHGQLGWWCSLSFLTAEELKQSQRGYLSRWLSEMVSMEEERPNDAVVLLGKWDSSMQGSKWVDFKANEVQ